MTREQRRAAVKAKKQAAAARRNQGPAQPGDLPPSESDEEEEEGEDEDEDIKKGKGKAVEKGKGKGSTEDNPDDEALPANPNHTANSRAQLNDDGANTTNNTTNKKKVITKGTDTSQLSRREREAIEAHQERERYMKLHAEGKTEEARSDLARLALVREQREADRARKEAEKEEKAERDKERAQALQRKLAQSKGGKKGGGGKNKR